MKNSLIMFALLLVGIVNNVSIAQELKPYAHKEKLTHPIEFTPGIISTGLEFGLSFAPDGREAYFSRLDTVRKQPVIHVSRYEKGSWQKATVVSFSGQYNDADALVTYDGAKLFFVSKRPLPNTGATPRKDHDVWWSARKGSSWSEPQHSDGDVNFSGQEGWPYVVDTTMYFFSDRGISDFEQNDIYILQNGWIIVGQT